MSSIITDTMETLVGRVETQVPGRVLDQLTTAVSSAEHLAHLGDMLVDHFIGVARAEGHSWAEIGTSMGVTRQAARQRGSRSEQFPEAVVDYKAPVKTPSPFAVWHLRSDDGIEVLVEPGQAYHRLVMLDGFDLQQLIQAAKKVHPEHWFLQLVSNLDEVYKVLGAELGPTAQAVLLDAAGRSVNREVDVTIAKSRVVFRNNKAEWADADAVRSS